MNQREKAEHFARLHVKGSPVILYNAWDAGSGKAIAGAGAKAIATSSWAIAAAHGYADGENIPVALARQVVGRIAATVDVPVTADIEGGYSEHEAALADTAASFLELGVAGVNFEDRVLHGEGLHAIDRQARRIAAVRAAAEKANVPLFINARTDVFFGRGTPNPADSVDAALERASAYAAAGASGFFVPGLIDESLIARIVERVALPVNIMMMKGAPSARRLGELGVARVSWGNMPYSEAMAGVGRAATAAFG